MKKKLFLIVATIAIMVLALAFSISAEEISVNTITNEAYGTIYQLSADPGLDNAEQYKSILLNIKDSGTEQETLCVMTDGTYYYVFPTSYIIVEFLNGQKGKFQYAVSDINTALLEWDEADENVTLPQFATSGAWGNTRLDNLVRIEFSKDVLWFDRQHCLVKSTNLKEAIMHDDIYLNTNLSTNIFRDCVALEKVRLSSQYTVITSGLFYDCKALKEITNWAELEPKLTAVGGEAFYNCSSLTSLTLDKSSITAIGQDTFNGCTSLASITLPNTVKSIGKNGFRSCKALTAFDVPDSLETLGSATFHSCSSLVRLEFPPTVKGFGQDEFHGCSSLEYINIPRDCTYIGNYTFEGCSKVNVDMSGAKSLTSTGSHNIWGVTTSLVFPEGFKTCAGISGGKITELVFPSSTTSIGVIQCSSLKEFVVPAGVTSLGDKSFDYCASLTKVTLPKGITVDITGDSAFYGTSKTNLKTIIYTGSEGDETITAVLSILKNASVTYANHCDVYFSGEHKLDGELTKYFEGEKYLSKYIEECACGNNCGKVVPVSEVAPLFSFLGYSRCEIPGSYAISNSFGVNYKAIKEYNELVGEEKISEYGLIAAGASEENVVNGDLINATKKATVSYTEKSFDIISMKISGFNDEASQEKSLYISAYIVIGGTYYYSNSTGFLGSATETVTYK